jgi:hypothetical protein
LPTFDASDHFLNPATKFRKIESRPVGAVTLWAIAIHNEERVFGITNEIPRGNTTMREIHGAWNMSSGIRLRAANVQQHKIRFLPLHRFVHVPAVGLQ